MIQLKIEKLPHSWLVKGNDIAEIKGNGITIQEAIGEYLKLFKLLTQMDLVNYKWS